MLKFLLILSIVVYLVYKVGTLLFRAGAASHRFQYRNDNSTGNGRAAKKKEFKGGEYIDYEEVK